MVSRAERQALDRAEELSRQAAEMLTLIRRRRLDPQHPNGRAAGPNGTAGPTEAARPNRASGTPTANGTEGGGESSPEHPEGTPDRRRAAVAARAHIEQQLRAELQNLAGVLDQTRTDLEDLLAEGMVIDLRLVEGLGAVTEAYEAGVGHR
jgi:hypothetical protein